MLFTVSHPFLLLYISPSPQCTVYNTFTHFHTFSFPVDCFHFRCRQNPHLFPRAFPSLPSVPSSSPAVCKHLSVLLHVTRSAFRDTAHKHWAVPCLPGQCCKEQMGSGLTELCSDELPVLLRWWDDVLCTVSHLNLATHRFANLETGNWLKNLAAQGLQQRQPEPRDVLKLDHSISFNIGIRPIWVFGDQNRSHCFIPFFLCCYLTSFFVPFSHFQL